MSPSPAVPFAPPLNPGTSSDCGKAIPNPSIIGYAQPPSSESEAALGHLAELRQLLEISDGFGCIGVSNDASSRTRIRSPESWWRGLDSNQRTLARADLQSAA